VAAGMAEGIMIIDLKVTILIWWLLLNILVFTKFVLFWTSIEGKFLNSKSLGCGFSDIQFSFSLNAGYSKLHWESSCFDA
jgi:hypothetical protein